MDNRKKTTNKDELINAMRAKKIDEIMPSKGEKKTFGKNTKGYDIIPNEGK